MRPSMCVPIDIPTSWVPKDAEDVYIRYHPLLEQYGMVYAHRDMQDASLVHYVMYYVSRGHSWDG